MFYILKLPGGNARITMEKPVDDTQYYVEMEEYPEGTGILKFDSNNNLFFGAIPIVPDPVETAKESEPEPPGAPGGSGLTQDQIDFVKGMYAGSGL